MEIICIINTIIFGVISWTTLLLITRKMFHKRSFEFCSRLVSIGHALQAVFLAFICVQDWTNPVSPLSPTSSPLQMQILAVNLAYFIYDLGRYCFDKNVEGELVIHHLFAIVGIGSGLAYQTCGTETMAALCIGEITGPFIHLRKLLKELQYKDTSLNVAADIMFATAFTLSRMIYEPYFTYLILTAKNPLLLKAACLGIQLLGIFWFDKMVRVCAHKYWFKRRTSSHKSHPN